MPSTKMGMAWGVVYEYGHGLKVYLKFEVGNDEHNIIIIHWMLENNLMSLFGWYLHGTRCKYTQPNRLVIFY